MANKDKDEQRQQELQRNAAQFNDATASNSFDTEAGAELGANDTARAMNANAMAAQSNALNTEAGEEFGELNISDKAKSQMSHNAVDAEEKDENANL